MKAVLVDGFNSNVLISRERRHFLGADVSTKSNVNEQGVVKKGSPDDRNGCSAVALVALLTGEQVGESCCSM